MRANLSATQPGEVALRLVGARPIPGIGLAVVDALRQEAGVQGISGRGLVRMNDGAGLNTGLNGRNASGF